jgi:peptide/nickel transport system substrate-binding protein
MKNCKLLVTGLAIIMVMTMALPVFAGGAKEEAVPQGVLKEELVIGVIQNPRSLDPHHSRANASRLITFCMYNSLVFLNADTATIEPDLAESWTTPAPNVYVFKLRKDVKFHDGRTMTAKDVEYSFKRAATFPDARPFVAGITETKVIDDLTFQVTLDKPSPVFLNNISDAIVSIIPDGSGDTAGTKPIGTGPFKFVEWSTDNYVLLDRHDDFYKGAKPTKRLRIRVIPDNTARNLALEARDLDIAHQIQNADYSMLEKAAHVTVYKTPSVLVEYIGMQVEKPPFDDIHARRAVAYALNKDAYIQAIFGGDYLNAKSFVNSNVLGYHDKIRVYEHSLQKAKEELALSKYKNGFEFDLFTTRARGVYTEALQHDLSKVGIKMNVIFVENVQSHCSPGYQGAHITSVQYPSLDPDMMYRYLHSQQKGTGLNLAWYGNAKVDNLLERGRSEMNTATRVAIYKEIQDIIADELPYIPLHSIQAMIGALSNVKGVDAEATTVHYFYDAYYEY